MEVTRSMVCRWSKMGKSDDRSIVVVGTVDEAKDGSGWGRTVGFGPHELRGDVLHVGKLPRDLGGHRRRVASRPLVAEASAVCDVKTRSRFCANGSRSYFLEPPYMTVSVWRIV